MGGGVCGFDPWWGTEILHAAECGQKLKTKLKGSGCRVMTYSLVEADAGLHCTMELLALRFWRNSEPGPQQVLRDHVQETSLLRRFQLVSPDGV